MTLVWEMQELKRAIRIAMPDPEVRVRASSSYDADTILHRLAVIEGRTDYEAETERAFLKGLLMRDFPSVLGPDIEAE